MITYIQNREKDLEISIKNVLAEIDNIIEKLKRLETASMNIYGSDIPSVGIDAEKLNIELTAQKNIYTQLKAQYELLKVEMASETPVFQILDMPEIPEKKSGPSRAKICIIAFGAGLFFSIFLAFLLNALQEIWKDPVFRAKLLRKREVRHEA